MHHRIQSGGIRWLALLMLVLAARARAQGAAGIVEEALDQVVTQRIEIPEQPLAQAAAALEQKTGLRLAFDKSAFEMMPYRDRTRVSIVIENCRVRDALQSLFDGLGLEMAVEGDQINVRPGPALRRLGRALTIEEAQLLGALARGRWSALDHAKLPISAALDAEKQQELDRQLAQAAGLNAVRELDAATAAARLSWTVEGGRLSFITRKQDIEQRLERKLSMVYQRVTLDELLVDLGRRIDVTFVFAPGALRAVNAENRKMDLIQRESTVRQTLERICGNTGLRYGIEDDGVHIQAPPGAAPSTGGARRVIAILRVPVGDDGTSVEFPIYDDELPPDVLKLREKKLPEVIEELRKRG
ncbi:hypothetical protein RAS1_12500 [Phycisphaerae bacterium RAS1]|nr:hypothetical protein RAS1_12500 [Phycisphaerae bacterium RAS1]